MRKLLTILALFLAVAPAPTLAQIGEEVLPPVFVETLLELPDDAAHAAKSGKRLLLYFGQVGCPYCKELMQTSFTQKALVDKVAKHFLPIAFNLFGDREVTWFDGKPRSEKEFAKFLKVQFTPTILLLDEKGNIIARINGYYPPHRFSAALDYSAQRLEGKRSFAEHMQAVPQTGASARLNEQPFFMKPPYMLARKAGGKSLAVLFETRSEKVYTLSPTGAAVVREVIAGAESGNLVSKLKEKFEDPTGKMAAEAESFLAQLKEKGLIVE